LRYIRDKEGREVDFAVLKEGEIEELIEVKAAEENVTRSLRYYAERLQPKRATQIVANLRKPYAEGKISVIDPLSYFNEAFFS
jgi:predicted AAA+ superfamily ATPase